MPPDGVNRVLPREVHVDSGSGASAVTGFSPDSCGWSIGCLSGLQLARVVGRNGLRFTHLLLDRLVSSTVDF